MKIIVTEVTEMGDGKVCVAGWCRKKSRMIRPKFGNDSFWSKHERGTPPQIGEILKFNPNGTPLRSQLPHAREDTLVRGLERNVGFLSEEQLLNRVRDSVSPTVPDIFGGHLVEKKYVLVDTDCASLGAVDTLTSRMGFETGGQNGVPQLRCWFYVGYDPNSYNFPVTSVRIKKYFAKHRTEGMNIVRQKYRRAHIRIGLARAFSNGRCYAMVNHIYLY